MKWGATNHQQLTGGASVFDVRSDEQETLGLRRHVNQHRHRDQPGEEEAEAVQRDVQFQRLVQFHSLTSPIHF